MLKGAELLAKVKELGAVDRDTLIRACGYATTSKNGKERLNVIAFHDALLEAKGIELPPPAPKTRKAGGGKKLNWNVGVLKTGMVPLSAGYTRLLGLNPGDRVAIAHVGETLVLRKSVESNATQIEEPAAAVDTVTTYESQPTPVGAGVTPF